jgi:hypothetical protein
VTFSHFSLFLLSYPKLNIESWLQYEEERTHDWVVECWPLGV